MAPSLDVNGKKVALTNLKKELWPGEGIHKYHLIKYYLEVSPYLLPHLRGRPLVFQRFPQGIDQPGFFQKNLPAGAPDWLETASIRHGEKVTKYLLSTGPETLAWLGNQVCLEIHPWLSALAQLNKPDYVVFDLDPMEEVPFKWVCHVALAFHSLLQKKGLRCYPKTSGSRGLQLYLPLVPLYSYEQARAFALSICRIICRQLPKITTLERKLAKRGREIYLDYLQNARGKTIVAPYSLRPRPGAPVSAPLCWSEVKPSSLNPSSFHLKSIFSRLQEKGDLFAPVLTDRQKLPEQYDPR